MQETYVDHRIRPGFIGSLSLSLSISLSLSLYIYIYTYIYIYIYIYTYILLYEYTVASSPYVATSCQTDELYRTWTHEHLDQPRGATWKHCIFVHKGTQVNTEAVYEFVAPNLDSIVEACKAPYLEGALRNPKSIQSRHERKKTAWDNEPLAGPEVLYMIELI